MNEIETTLIKILNSRDVEIKGAAVTKGVSTY
jgi:hypothetical protein